MSLRFRYVGNCRTAKDAYMFCNALLGFKGEGLNYWESAEAGIHSHGGFIFDSNGTGDGWYGTDPTKPSGITWIDAQSLVAGYFKRNESGDVPVWDVYLVDNTPVVSKTEWSEWTDMLVFHDSDDHEYTVKWDYDEDAPAHPLTVIHRTRKDTNDE